MCQMCADNMRTVRILLAQKIVGLLPKEDDTALEETTVATIKEFAQRVGHRNIEEGKKIYGCQNFRGNMITGISKALPKLTREERFEMTLAASGAIKLGI